MPNQPNALVNETSPYLLQHAYNPVHWYPWGAEALERAKSQNKLIFLSIGYAACHWCHVMEHESFEDEEVAAILNRDFISIKVDREERPDLDEIYMSATMLFTGGHGGWPMSVFLMPDQRPVFAGTYFPKDDAYGRPGFKNILQQVATAWQTRGEAMVNDGAKVVEAIRQIHGVSGAGQKLSREQVSQLADQTWRAYDHVLGGVLSGGTNKFPPSLSMDLMLREYNHLSESRYLEAVEVTLEQMARGGIYDHLGGGIHRYSTDPRWLVPHFEKMLYDQGLVASIYIDGRQATGRPELKTLCAETARGICDYVMRDLTSPDGAFYSSEDADSEGKEGLFYIWTREEIDELLGKEDSHVFCSHYGVTISGTWNHPGDAHVPKGPKNILHVDRPVAAMAKLEHRDAADIERVLAESRRKLVKVREQRTRPGLDNKILTGWNGLMITALAKAAAVLEEPRYGEAAGKAAEFLLREVRASGRLCASLSKGSPPLKAYITDYAFLVEGLIELYQWSGETRWLNAAEELTDTALRFHWDEGEGGFYFTASDHEELIVRTKGISDGATPSGNSVMLMNLQRLAILLDRRDYREKAEKLIMVYAEASMRSPFQFERFLAGVEAWQKGFVELAIVGDPEDERTQALLRTIHERYLPNKVIAQSAPGDDTAAKRVPLLSQRPQLDGRPTVYLCRNFTCREPTADPDALAKQLAEQ